MKCKSMKEMTDLDLMKILFILFLPTNIHSVLRQEKNKRKPSQISSSLSREQNLKQKIRSSQIS